MPTANLVLMLMIGIVFGVASSVALRGRGALFVVNILLGVVGAALGAFMPVLIGQSPLVDTDSPDYLLRALLGAFLLVLLASLFRSAKPRRLD